MSLYDRINTAYGGRIRALASQLHRHPELGFQEYDTTALIKREAAALGVEPLELGLETGFVGLIHGGDGAGIALRADIDAIRQTEEAQRPDRSETQGLMHGCGHDTHCAGLLGAAMYLSEHREQLSGDVLLIFQPAEELLGGAKYLLDHGLWERFWPAEVMGLHNLPQLPVGTVGLRSGPLMAYKDGFQIRYLGRSGHTSTPQKNVDPTVAIAALVMALQTVVSRNVGPLEQAVVTVCSISSGQPFTTTVDDAVITGNIRTLDPEVRRRVLERVRAIAEFTASAYGCVPETDIHQITAGVINSEALLPTARAAAEAVFGAENVALPSVNLASEDFSLLSQGKEAFFYFLGSGIPGEQPVLWHNPCFHAHPDTPVYGAALLAQSVLEAQRRLGG